MTTLKLLPMLQFTLLILLFIGVLEYFLNLDRFDKQDLVTLLRLLLPLILALLLVLLLDLFFTSIVPIKASKPDRERQPTRSPPSDPTLLHPSSTDVSVSMSFDVTNLTAWAALWTSVWTSLRIPEAVQSPKMIDHLRLRLDSSTLEPFSFYFDRFFNYLDGIFSTRPSSHWQLSVDNRAFETVFIFFSVHAVIMIAALGIVWLASGLVRLVQRYQERRPPTLEEVLSGVRERTRE
ncbi:hypothetical protein NDA16_004287 [Ustilago loliicola]|nr:hypothetical protein NDA16_004287 [Ustilago loliicola]